jgi:plastocyanin
MLGATRSAVILGALCLICAAPGAIAAPAHSLRHRSSHKPTCRRTKHRRCPATHANRGSRRKHRRGEHSKATKPKHGSDSSGPTSSWATVPGAVGPGSTPVSPSGSSSSTGGTAPEESPATPPAPAHVEVTAEDTEAFRFVLSRPSVPAGHVIIEFVNHGQDEHNLNALEPAEGSVAGSIPNTAPNAHPSLSVDLRRGSYTLFCSIADHEAKGMKATLVVY